MALRGNGWTSMGKIAGRAYTKALSGLDSMTANKILAIGGMGVGAGLYATDASDGYVGIGGSLGLLAAGSIGARWGYNYGSALSKKALHRKGWTGTLNRGFNTYAGLVDEAATGAGQWAGRGAFARGWRQG